MVENNFVGQILTLKDTKQHILYSLWEFVICQKKNIVEQPVEVPDDDDQDDGDAEYDDDDDDDNARSWSGGAQMAICPPPNSAPSITINFETAPEPPKCKRNFTPFDVLDAAQYKQL